MECAELASDNNMTEWSIKPFVIGRKNRMFNGSPEGADASCGMFSLIETVKANGLNPYDYLFHVFEKAPFARTKQDWHSLLAWNIEINAAGNVKNAV
jgi:transposase